MTTENTAADHHSSAAAHHQQAAQHHRDASKHYQFGKDWAHAAHQAFLARGYALHGIAHGIEAARASAGHPVDALPGNPNSFEPIPIGPRGTTGTDGTRLRDVDHHAAAADHSEQAAFHHDQAANHWNGGDYAQAGHEARIAFDHSQESLLHGDEAAKYHVEHYGKAGPTAEIV